MATNKWEVVQLAQERVIIQRVEDGIPVAEMAVSLMGNDELLQPSEAVQVAQQICDDWNFSCDDELQHIPESWKHVLHGLKS